MELKIGSKVLIFILLLSVIFTSVAHAKIITVCSSGCDYMSIQSAINSANIGDTIGVYSGVYYENVNVDKQLIMRRLDTGAGKPVVDAGGSGNAITLSANGITLEGFEAINSGSYWPYLDSGIKVTSNNNVIKNNIVSNNHYGIYLVSSSNNTIFNNNASNNYIGIHLGYSSNNTLSTNNANSNNLNGIYLSSSSSNTLSNNKVSNNYNGIYLYGSSNNILSTNNASNNLNGISLEDSSNNTLKNNSMFNNIYNFGVYGNELSDFIQYIDKTNYVNGKTIYYLVSEKNLQIPRDAGYVGIVNSENITVKYLTLNNNTQGVLLANTSNSRIEKVIAENNRYGIYLYSSSNNTISNNNASNNYYGIYLSSSSNNILFNNNASNNDYGISLGSSSNNKIYLNNFINNPYYSHNSYNIWISTEKINYTYNGNNYTSYLGNYWSDYTGSDADNEGIGDTPYYIEKDQDNYPLMENFENYFVRGDFNGNGRVEAI